MARAEICIVLVFILRCRFGYNTWRDPQKPTQILERLCREFGFDAPEFKPREDMSGSILHVAGRQFEASEIVENLEGRFLTGE